MADLPPTQSGELGVQLVCKTDFALVFHMLLDNQNRFSNAHCPPYPQLVGLVAAKFGRVTKCREARLRIMSDYAGREISSTKDLTTAECVVWLKMLEREPFIEFLKEGNHAETETTRSEIAESVRPVYADRLRHRAVGDL